MSKLNAFFAILSNPFASKSKQFQISPAALGPGQTS